jgi:hypothetical protein
MYSGKELALHDMLTNIPYKDTILPHSEYHKNQTGKQNIIYMLEYFPYIRCRF